MNIDNSINLALHNMLQPSSFTEKFRKEWVCTNLEEAENKKLAHLSKLLSYRYPLSWLGKPNVKSVTITKVLVSLYSDSFHRMLLS